MGFLNSSGTRVERNRLFVTNDEGSILPPGTPVYIKSRSNDEIMIGMSDADIDATMPAIGITIKKMKVGESADILLGGFVDEIELGGLTAATVGQTLYVSQTGTLTNVEPAAGTVQSIGTILEVNAAGDTATEALIAFGGAGAGGGGGASTFIELTDVEGGAGAYVPGDNGFLVAQNGTANGVEFIDPSTVGTTTLTGLSDTPAGYGTNGQVLTTNGTSAATWEDAPSPVGVDLALNTRDTAYTTTGHHEGTVLSIGSTALTAGTVYMWDGTQWNTANAGAVATADGLMGVATATATGPDVLVSGIIYMSATGSVGDPLYLDTTTGALNATAPSASTEIVRVMGYKLDANRVYFNPSNDWLEIV